jgi:hypothetical protein
MALRSVRVEPPRWLHRPPFQPDAQHHQGEPDRRHMRIGCALSTAPSIPHWALIAWRLSRWPDPSLQSPAQVRKAVS